MARNAFAGKMVAAAGRLRAEERKELVHRCLTTIYQASVVALNDQFGFGSDRITRFRDAMEATIMEYGALMDGTDAGYADGALERRYLQIMGSDRE